MCVELMLNAVNLTLRRASPRARRHRRPDHRVLRARGGRRRGRGRPRHHRAHPAQAARRHRRRPRRVEGLRPTVLDLVWLIPALPLAGFLSSWSFGRRLGEPQAGWLATLMVGGVVRRHRRRVLRPAVEDGRGAPPRGQALFTWLPVGGAPRRPGVPGRPAVDHDGLFVTGIGTLIHLYSIGYMHGDPKFSKFFVYLNLFVFSMLMLVLGDEPARHVPRLGGRGHLLLLPDLVLVHHGVSGHGRQEGLHHQPRR